MWLQFVVPHYITLPPCSYPNIWDFLKNGKDVRFEVKYSEINTYKKRKLLVPHETHGKKALVRCIETCILKRLNSLFVCGLVLKHGVLLST